MTQLNIFDALASLDAKVVMTMEAEPGWMWTRCRKCQEYRYQKRTLKLGTCAMTPKCEGVVEAYLQCLCQVCGKPVTRRREGADTRFCSKKCEVSS